MSEPNKRFEEEFRDSIATVDARGKRVWVFPKKQIGKFFKKRSIVAYSLLAILFAGPFIRINGEPLLLLNVIERKFVILGAIFWPEDIFLFAIGMVAFVVLIIVFTVVFGRVFCGWACPQTIFMEMIFRRIEYLIDGDWNHQKRLNTLPWNKEKIIKRTLKWSIFWIISFVIANIFLAYIIGSEELKKIIIDDPTNHLGGLLSILIFTSVFFFVYAWFREQVCIAVCPYGRLQGVLLDKNSILVAYDYLRGETRAKFRKNEDRSAAKKGDCIDCNQCVNVCPTGIDIRNGTQLECINCTLCIDACDSMMKNVGLPTGLIRLDSEHNIKTKEKFKLTARAKAYIGVMAVIVALLITLLSTRSEIDVTILRVRGTSYQKIDEQNYSNIYEATFTNKSNKEHIVLLKVLSENAKIEIIGGPILLKVKEQIKRELLIKMNRRFIDGPKTEVEVGVFSGEKLIRTERINFSGPGF